MDGDEPTGDWATFHDSVHDVFMSMKFNAMLVFIIFSTEENFVSSSVVSPKFFHFILQNSRMFHLYLSIE